MMIITVVFIIGKRYVWDKKVGRFVNEGEE